MQPPLRKRKALKTDDEMRYLDEFKIPFKGLKLGKHQFEFEINNEFFEHFEYEEFNNANVKIDLLFEKKSTMMELTFKATGTVNVDCDITNEAYDQPINSSLFLVVKFGDEFNDDDEDILILPHGEYEVDVKQYVYELIVLAVPAKKIHPGVEDGSLSSEVLEKLEELSPKGRKNKNEGKTDPRWDKLKNLLNE